MHGAIWNTPPYCARSVSLSVPACSSRDRVVSRHLGDVGAIGRVSKVKTSKGADVTSDRFYHRSLATSLVAAVGIAGSLACYDPQSPCACTEEYRTYTLLVIDQGGAPVPDAIITRTHLRTGEVLEPGWLGMLQPGVYLVADDGMLDVFSSEGDTVRVTGTGGAAAFAADFVFAVPDPCRCHVERVSGPDSVWMVPVALRSIPAG